MGDDPILSPLAREQMTTMLPTLLAKVRRRRRRRRVQRAGVAAVLLGLLSVPFWSAKPPVDPPQQAPRAVPVASICEIVGDRDDVLARYAVSTDVRAEWFIDDAQLQQLLRDDGRPSGLVRIAGRVSVAEDAVDPLSTMLE